MSVSTAEESPTVGAQEPRAASRSRRRGALAQLRDTINVELLHSEMEQLLLSEERDLAEWHGWAPVLCQVRVSSADTKWGTVSSSPARQVKQLAAYCVRYRFRPVELCFEAQSGSLSEAKPRRLFERYYERLAAGELAVVAVITYNIDRFTRDRFVGEKWLQMLKARGIDLLETDEMEPPAPLATREAEYAKKLFGAWRENRRAAKRIGDARKDRSRDGGLVWSVNHYGHRPVYEMRNGRRVQVRGVIVEAEAHLLREASERLANGEPVHRIAVDLNERGERGRYGGLWESNTLSQLLRSPRMAGYEVVEGQPRRADIEPILSEEEWRRNQALLSPEESSEGRRRAENRASYSHLLTCASCGARMALAGRGYRCQQTKKRGRRRCTCGESTACRCLAANRHQHAYRSARVIETLLVEVALAAVMGTSTDVREHAELERGRLGARLMELDGARRELARRQREHPESVDDQELADIVEAAHSCREKLARLGQQRSRLAPELSPERMRERVRLEPRLLDEVIEQLVVHPRPEGSGYGTPYSGITVRLRAPYALDEASYHALCARLNEAHPRALRRALPWSPRWSRQAALEAYEYHRRGRSAQQIAHLLNERGFLPSCGHPVWRAGDINSMLRRVCDERDVPYQRNKGSRYPPETRQLVYELASNPKTPFTAVAADLERMGICTPSGRPWGASVVRTCYVAECNLRGEKPVPRDTRKVNSRRS